MTNDNLNSPSNKELLRELRTTRRIAILAIIMNVIIMLSLIAALLFAKARFEFYSAKVNEAFTTMQKIDDLVDDVQLIKSTYEGYQGQIENVFDTMDELQNLITKAQDLINQLSQLPFVNLG